MSVAFGSMVAMYIYGIACKGSVHNKVSLKFSVTPMYTVKYEKKTSNTYTVYLCNY